MPATNLLNPPKRSFWKTPKHRVTLIDLRPTYSFVLFAVHSAEGSSEQSVTLSRSATLSFRLFSRCVHIRRSAPSPRSYYLRDMALLLQSRTSQHLRLILPIVAPNSDAERGCGCSCLDGTPRRLSTTVRNLRSDQWIARIAQITRSHSETDGLHHPAKC